MKANGKNLELFMYQSHDYMDFYPEKHFKTVKSQEVMDKFIEHMRNHWSSGTVSNAKKMSPLEYFEERQSKYWKGYERDLDVLAEDCCEEWLCEYRFYVEHKDFEINSLKREWDCIMEEIANYDEYCDAWENSYY